jgi:hypothetical protein
LVIYALLVIATLAVSTAIVVALIIRAPLVDDDGDGASWSDWDASEPCDEESDETPVVSNHGEGGGHLDPERGEHQR